MGTPNYIWQQHANPRFLELAGHKDALVDTRDAKGKNGRRYLWQYRKRYGYGATIEDAKEWVEVLADHYSIPPAQRWLSL
jgi:hypothetical protein